MISSRMLIPAWEAFTYEPLSYMVTDVWNKFDMDPYSNDTMKDFTLDSSQQHHCETPLMMNFDMLNCKASREIRHHDCMWAGLCISKEHNRTLPAKKDPKIQRRIPAGRSLLIPKNLQQQQQQQQMQQPQTSLLHQNQHGSSPGQSNGFACRSAATSTVTKTKNLESDGDSTRPETPQSSGESETESEEEEEEEEEEDEEDEVPIFKHEQISINDIVSVSEATGCNVQRRPAVFDRRKEDEKANIRNTFMSDHCYHLSQQQPISKVKNLDHLGVQTPSDSEEEIDVVSWDKPTRPVNPNYSENHRCQFTVNTASKGRHSNKESQSAVQHAIPAAAPTTNTPPAPRPRGRPPSNATIASRKRAAEALEQTKATTGATPNKRAKTTTPRTYKKRQTAASKASPQSSPGKTNSSSEEEPDTEKRSLHNNMERQRRIELRNAFEELRLLVPEVEAKEKAPKVAILRQAAYFCDRLIDQEHDHLTQIAELRRKQDKLKAHLGFLRRTLAMMR